MPAVLDLPVRFGATQSLASRAAILAALLATFAPAHADNRVKLTTGVDYPPYASDKLPGGGMLTEVTIKAFRAAGQYPSLEWLPWRRGYEMTKSGRYSATFPYIRSAEREAEMFYSDSMLEVPRYLWSAKQRALDVRNLDTFRGLHYCAPLGYATAPVFDALILEKKLHLERPADLASCAKMVAAGRADFFVEDLRTGHDAIKDLAHVIQPSREPVGTMTYHLIASKSTAGSQQVIDAFNRGLAILKRNGEWASIVKKHGG